jgi:nicotinic acid phosphoribosyltransferase
MREAFEGGAFAIVGLNTGTATMLAEEEFDIPTFGTMAHSFIANSASNRPTYFNEPGDGNCPKVEAAPGAGRA